MKQAGLYQSISLYKQKTENINRHTHTHTFKIQNNQAHNNG